MTSSRSAAEPNNGTSSNLLSYLDQVIKPLPYTFIEVAPRLESVAQRRMPSTTPGQSQINTQTLSDLIVKCEALRAQVTDLNATKKSQEAITTAQKLKLICEEELRSSQPKAHAIMITNYLVEALFGEATALRTQSDAFLSRNQLNASLEKSHEALLICRRVNALNFIDPEMKKRLLVNTAIVLHDIGSVKFKLSLELARSTQWENALLGTYDLFKIYEEVFQILPADHTLIPHIKKSLCASIQLHTMILMNQIPLLKNQNNYLLALQKAKEAEACAKAAMTRFPEIPVSFCDIAARAINEQASMYDQSAAILMVSDHFSEARFQLNLADLACTQAMALNPSRETLIAVSDTQSLVLQRKIDMLSTEVKRLAILGAFDEAVHKAKQIENLCFRALGLFSPNPPHLKGLKDRRDWAVQSQEALRKKIAERAVV